MVKFQEYLPSFHSWVSSHIWFTIGQIFPRRYRPSGAHKSTKLDRNISESTTQLERRWWYRIV